MNWKGWLTDLTYTEAARAVLGLMVLVFLLRWAIGRLL